MYKKELKRTYKQSDAALIQQADSIHSSATRDAADLTAYGVLPATLTDLETARNAFADTDTDEELMGDMVIATQAKNALRNSLLTKIRQITDRARIKYGEEDGKFRKFGAELLTKNTDVLLVRTANRVGRVATQFLAELVTEGLTAPIIADMLAENDLFDTAIDTQDDAIKDRDLAVQYRVMAGNALYALVANLAAKGKLCYQETNEAKYNDYILNPNSTASDTENTLQGTVAANSVVNISATGISEATVYTIHNTGLVPLKFYFGIQPTDTSGLAFVMVPPNATQVATAMDLGYNDSQNYVRLIVNNELPQDGSYEVTYD